MSSAPIADLQLRPLQAGDAAELLRILQTPEVAHWWDVPDPGFPLTDEPEAVRRVVDHLVDERGHHRVVIDPAVANQAAIKAYAKAGFRPVGVMREYERDAGGEGWHDGVLMELLASDR
jgi:hypothetical protein